MNDEYLSLCVPPVTIKTAEEEEKIYLCQTVAILIKNYFLETSLVFLFSFLCFNGRFLSTQTTHTGLGVESRTGSPERCCGVGV
ncbi:hypothetical protein CSUI_000031 [Cystoisospora suis]|uniref:Uncharacterized protein n=1 Tax=Cystoisospora suis TaxID=483139 RepID=A0A2C6LII8_9APIC|nr:hypothetical protein CSUI_000031 [Cystoisospora suis]